MSLDVFFFLEICCTTCTNWANSQSGTCTGQENYLKSDGTYANCPDAVTALFTSGEFCSAPMENTTYENVCCASCK